MNNFKKVIGKILILFFTLLLCFSGVYFSLAIMSDIWNVLRGVSMVGVWWPGIGIAGVLVSVSLIGIIVCFAPNRRPPKIFFYSTFFFFVFIIISPFMDTLLPLGSYGSRALQQEGFYCCGIPCPWNTYYDERYKYKIDFPSGLNVNTIYENTNTFELSEDLGGGFLTLTTNGGVIFSPLADMPGVMSVEVFENSKFQSLDEWLESEKNKYEISVVEKKINIDGNEAIVTHRAGMLNGKISEEYKQPKTTVFFKDNKLFVIFTRIDDHEKVWNSFKFITGDYPIY